jgi:hypothetical protein
LNSRSNGLEFDEQDLFRLHASVDPRALLTSEKF